MNKPSNILSNTINIPHKACFLPVTVGQKSLFSPLDLFLILPPPSSYFGPSSLPLLFFYQPMPSSSSLVFSCVPFSLLRSSCLSSIPSSPQGQLVCVELTTRQLLHCLLSLSSCPLRNNAQPCLANHQPQWQQYRTPT